MALKLVVTTNVNGDVFELILKKPTYRVGRRRDNDLRIKETYVSGYHSELNRNADGEYELKDCGSSNGTFLNGLRVEKPTVVQAGDFIKFGILKVAVVEHEATGPKVVSLKDRPAFAKKRNDMTASIPAESSATGKVGTTDVSADSQPVSGSSSEVSGTELKEVEELLENEEKRAKELAGKLEAQEKSAASLGEEIESLKAELAEMSEALRKAEEAKETTAREVSDKSAELESLQEKLAAAEEEAREAKETVEAVGREAEEAVTVKAGLDKENETLQSELASLRETLAEKEAEIAAEAESGKEASELLEKKDSEIEALRGELENLKSDFESRESDLQETLAKTGEEEKKTAEELRKREGEIQTLQAELDSLKESLSGKESALKASASEAARLATLTAIVAALESDLSASSKEAKEAGKERARLEEELRRATTRLEEADNELASLKSTVEEKEEHLATLSSDAKELENVRSELESTRADFEKTTADLRSERDETTARLSEQEAAAKALSEELAEAKKALAGETGKLTSELESLRSEREQLMSDLSGREEALSGLKEELSSKIASLETALASEKVRASDSKSKAETLKQELEDLRTELTGAGEEKSGLQKRLEEVSKTNGRVQAELNRESARAGQLEEDLAASRNSATELRGEIDQLRKTLVAKDREIADMEQEFARNESDALVELKRQLGEVQSGKSRAEEEVEKARKEKLALSGSFDRLKAQFEAAEKSIAEASTREESILHDKGVLARRLEKVEASNSELAARIKEDATTALANRNLIEKLETQIRENESEAVKREQKHIAELKAEISRLQREGHARTSERDKLQAALDETTAARKAAEEKALELRERIVALESEGESTCNLLQETEKRRAELSSQLSDQTELAENRGRVIEEQKADLAETVAKAKASEESLLIKHRDEIDVLNSGIRSIKDRNAALEAELENTRVGLSEALRRSREQSEAEKVRLLSEGNTKLAEIEVELSSAIRSREDIEAVRNQLEDELNEREERIERLSERIEDLELQIQDEKDSGEKVRLDLQTTREGLSSALSASRRHLQKTEQNFVAEKQTRERVEANYAEAQDEIRRLREESEELQAKFQSEIRDWEERYDQLREEKLTLATEDANLKRIRDEIESAKGEKQSIESELSRLSEGVKTFQSQYDGIKTQKEDLVRDREELKAGLNAARSELETVQRRCSESQAQESKLSATIESAEKRIQSLKKLEAEMEQAFERKRQKGVLSRSDVFSEATADLIAAEGEFSKEDFYRKLIARLDLIDDLSKRYDNRWRYPKVADQLSLLKGSFVDFLHDHSVREFQLEPGTVLSVEERKRIKLVPPTEANGIRLPETNGKTNGRSNGSRVVQTIRPGYVYRNGSRDVIIRKAEVIVA